MLVCIPLIYIIKKMRAHCGKGEYISIGADQWPLDRRHWDEGSVSSVNEEEQDEESTQGDGVNVNDEAPEANGNTECTEVRTTQV